MPAEIITTVARENAHQLTRRLGRADLSCLFRRDHAPTPTSASCLTNSDISED